jgi:mono/diheme cytochrome c family protein
MMRRFVLVFSGVVFAVALAIAAVLLYARASGLGTRADPGAVETALARTVRRFAVPAAARAMSNPVAASPQALAEGMNHYADHCAVCHANDGSGSTEMGRGLYPKAPDMRLPATQELADGELFHIIENGVRFTGMPGWGGGTAADRESTWQLVHFIRQLTRLTSAELEVMQERNPRSIDEVREQLEEERFLNGGAQ